MYEPDFLSAMLETENQMKDFQRNGNQNVFSNYFNLQNIINSAQFCTYIDSLSLGIPECMIRNKFL